MVLITTVELSNAENPYEECYNEATKGRDYRGNKDTSKSGFNCRSWEEASDEYNPTQFPDDGLADGAANLCRNPGAIDPEPWCMVSTLDTGGDDYELCGIEKCPAAVIAPPNKRIIPMYTSEHTINCVVKNLKEQVSEIEWKTDRETDISYTPQDGVYEDSTQTSSITLTKENLIALQNSGERVIKFTCTVKVPHNEITMTAVQTLILEEPYEECFNEATKGRNYRGNVDTSKSGFNCRSWEEASDEYNPTQFPDDGLADGAANLCRNPGAIDPEPWCMVSTLDTGGDDYELCGIEKCPAAVIAPPNKRIIPMYTSEHTINCVVKNLKEQVSEIEWKTDRETDISYTPQDGVYEDSTQTSSITLTKENLIALQNSGERVIKFTCKVKVPHNEITMTAVQTLILEEPYEECFDEATKGRNYRGNVDTSKSGFKCRSWEEAKANYYPTKFPDDGLTDGAANLCRNPGAIDPEPWCFVSHLDVNAGYEVCGLEKCPTVVITPAITSANIMEDHTINCVLEGLSGQVSGIEWMTDTKTDNSYSPKDGEFKDGTQTSSLTLTSEKLIVLKKVGDEHTFTCSITNSLMATQAVTLEGDLPDEDVSENHSDDGHDCEKTFSCTTSFAITNGKICWCLIVFNVFMKFTFA